MAAGKGLDAGFFAHPSYVQLFSTRTVSLYGLQCDTNNV